jgi:hypothetical protein
VSAPRAKGQGTTMRRKIFASCYAGINVLLDASKDRFWNRIEEHYHKTIDVPSN